MNSNSVPDNTEKTIRAHLEAKLSSFYLEELRSGYTEPRSDASRTTSSSNVSEPTEMTTIFGTEAFYADHHVRKIMEHCTKKGIDPIPRLRLLIFIEYKLSKLKVKKKDSNVEEYFKGPEPWYKPAKALRKDLDCGDEGSLLYRSLWPELIMKEPISEYRWYDVKCDETSLTVGGDCMCSAGWPLRNGLELFLNRLPETDPTLEKILKDDENYRPLIKNFQRAPIPHIKKRAPVLPIICHDLLSGNEYLRDVWANPFFLTFLKEAFSRTNWIIVPAGMNRPRGLDSNGADYWDRTMERMLANQGIADPETPESQITGLEKYRAPFQELLEREWMLPGEDSPKPGYQALLLEDWLYRDEGTGKLLPLYLPPRKARGPYPHPTWKNPGPKSFGEWETMLTEMTRRIKNRREKMLDALVNVPTEQLKENGLILSSFEEEQR